MWRFGFQASMGPGGRNKWVPYRVRTVDVGKRVLDILRDLKELPRTRRPADAFSLPSGALVVRPKTNR